MKKACEFDFVYDTQAGFRILLEALSNPGRLMELGTLAQKLNGPYSLPLTVAAILLDNEVSFAVCDNSVLAAEITGLTLAKQVQFNAADYIFISDEADLPSVVASAKCGTLRDPHKSALVILTVADLQTGKLQKISGPGIKGEQEIILCPELQEAMELRDAQSFEYPLGIDFLAVDKRGLLMGMPRKIQLESR